MVKPLYIYLDFKTVLNLGVVEPEICNSHSIY